MRRYGEKNGRRFGLGGGLARAALSALLVALLVLQSGPTQALAVVAEETAEQQLLAELTGEGGASGETGAPAGDEEPTAESTTGVAPEGSASAPSETGDPASDDAPSEEEAPEKNEPSAAPTEEAPSEEADPAPAGDVAEGDAVPTEDVAEQAPAAAAGDAAEAGPEAELFDENGLVAVTLQGEAASTQGAALVALRDEAGVDQDTARDAAAIVFGVTGVGDEPAVRDGEELPSGEGDPDSGSGSFVDTLQVRWITEDDDPDNGDADLLYLHPADDTDQSVRMRVSYALSGSYDYGPGEVTITVPVNIFTDREGGSVGSMRLAVPENPSTTAAWNYQRVGDTFVITNTRRMSAASQGYIEFAIEGITPREVVDMAESDPFQAQIEVVTETGNVIGTTSNQITAQIDTFAKITSATKRAYADPEIVTADEIPEAQRVDGVDRYVLVTWYMNGYIDPNTNQKHTLQLTDTKTDEYEGFVLDASGTPETHQRDITVYEDGFDVSTTNYTALQTAYPITDQFKEGETYTFANEVTYTLTETDPAITDRVTNKTDEQEVTTATDEASVSWTYRTPTVVEPEGHFMLYKYGNSNVPYAGDPDGMETIRPSVGSVHTDTPSSGEAPYSGYFGDYPSALNTIRDGDDQLVSYTLNTIGYLLPWTYVEGSVETPAGGNPLGLLGNYGQKPVTMTTEDTGLSMAGEDLALGEDYVYTSVDFAATPVIKRAVAINLNEDGSVSFESPSDGTVDYEDDDDVTKIPRIKLQIRRNGSQEWESWATADWTSGALSVTLADGTTQAGSVVALPEGTTGVRTQVTAANAAVCYFVRVNATLLHDGALGPATAEAFQNSLNPVIEVDDTATMVATSYDDAEMSNPTTVATFEKTGTDRLHGYTADTRATIEKTGEQVEQDVNARLVRMHYEAEVSVESFITDRETYEQALADGTVTAEEGGTWYDLLPKGMVPLLDTVELREGDAVREMYTIEDYKGSGRTLLVVSADLTPVTSARDEGDVTYYDDVITIAFDATYSYESLESYGADPHNVVAYMSDNKELGTVEGYRGEADDPHGTNNVGTEHAFADDAELSAMVDLDPDRDDPNTVYAGTTTHVDVLEYATTDLTKRVMVNNDGWWSSGIEGHWDESGNQWVHEDGQNRDVYVGGRYSYRLSMGSGADSRTSQIVLYDTLENFSPAEENFDPNDRNDADTDNVWHGTFDGLDLSALETMGCAPVVYYSTQENLKLDQFSPENPDGGNKPEEKNLLLREDGTINDDVWQPLTDKTNLATVRAIAIDARKTAEGGDFVLQPEETVSVYVNMRAPSGAAAEVFVGNDAHAYNNVHMQSHTVNAATSAGGEDKFIHQEYTKVGLVAYELSVSKAWDDADNQDGKRPGSVTVHLYANGKPVKEAFPDYDWEGVATSRELSDENNWTGSFGNLPLYEDDGTKIIYSLVEDEVEGYVPDIRFDGDRTFTVTNRHEPEKVSVSGTKTWVGDTEGVRPDTVTVRLYADGTLADTQTVRADATGTWSFSFDGLDRYRDQGHEIVYTVDEDVTTTPSYVPSVDGTDITNTYHPYGDLVISKQTTDTTAASADKDFTFTLQFTRTGEDGQTEEPVLDSFGYIVYGADGTKVSEGTVATNGTVSLRAGQRAVISEIPEGVRYEVTEADVPGFTQSSDGATGTIEPNEEQEAAFTNAYASEVLVSLGARKVLTGRDLTRYQFRFELRDEDGNVVRTASNGAADVEETGDDGPVEQAPVDFGALTYTQADDGQTFTYTIHEVASGRGGYTYDQTAYAVEVTPHDKGDGTMVVDVVYKDAEDNTITGGSKAGSQAVFENIYRASGSFTPQVSKSVEGGELEAGAFAFEIGLVSTDGDGKTSFSPIQSNATNAADGTVTFEPIEYTQADAGKSFLYAIHEVAGADPTIDYDAHWSLVRVDVTDNGNGTLSLQTTFDGLSAACWACGGTGKVDGADCAACDNTGTITPADGSYEFVNSYHDGNLDVQKTVTGDISGTDPNQMFTFRVELTNEQGEPLDGITSDTVTFDQIDAPEQPDEGVGGDAGADVGADATPAAEPAGEENPVVAFAESALNFLGGLFLPETAYAAEVASGTVDNDDGTSWHWSLDDAGNLVIGGTGIDWGSNAPWIGDNVSRDSIHSVSFEESSVASGAWSSAFNKYTNLESVDVTHLDMSEITWLANTFDGCTALQNIDLSDKDLSACVSVNAMFQGCSSLTSASLRNVNLSSATTVTNMFTECTSLETVDLTGLNIGAVKEMYRMFAYCSELTEVDFSVVEDMSSVENMGEKYYSEGVFYQSGVQSVSFKNVSMPNLQTANYLFGGCDRLVLVDFSGVQTPNLEELYYLFKDCSSLTSVNLSDLDTDNVTDFAGLFSGCDRLTTVTFGEDFKTSAATEMYGMFSYCTSLSTLDLSMFDTRSVVSMASMFSGCVSLTELDLSSFDTSKVTSAINMFNNCRSLSRVTLGANFKFNGDGSALPTPRGKGEWVLLDEGGMPNLEASFTPEELVAAYPDTATPGTYVWNTWIQVTFKPNGGTGSMSAQTINTAADSVLNLSNGSIRHPGMRLEGWNTKADGTGKFYADGGTIPADTYLDETELTLYAQWTQIGTVETPSEGVLEIEMPAGYVAHLTDLPAGTSYRVYEETPAGWTLVESSGTTGTILPDQTQTAAFVNEHTPGKAQAQIVASKMLDSAWASAESGFEFELLESGSVLQTVKVADGGAVTFEPIAYTEEGVHTYTIREKAGTDSTIDYDDTQFEVKVSVTKDAAGNLAAEVTYPGDGSVPVFKNTTIPGSLSITKVATGAFEGGPSDEQTFSFRVSVAGAPYAGNYVVRGETRSTADGTISLTGGQTATISGLMPGSSYAVEEIALPEGWTLSNSSGLTGTISSGAPAQVSVTNTYAATGEAQLEAHKRLEGGAPADGQFTFELLDDEGTSLGTATNGPVDENETVVGEGDVESPNPYYGTAPVYFPVLTYDEPGTHVYTIREVVPDEAVNSEGVTWKDATDDQKAAGGFSLDGVVYDVTSHTATVTVTDNGDGTLATEVTYSDPADPAGSAETANTFVNRMERVDLTVKKTVTNDDLSHLAESTQNAEFEFTISLRDAADAPLTDVAGTVHDADGQPADTIKVSDGSSFSLRAGQYVTFTDLPYGTVYEVTETLAPGWSQDADSTSGTSGTLTGTGVTAAFSNTYAATGSAALEAVKTLDGQVPEEGRFSFALRDVTEGSATYGQVLETVENGADGMVSFSPISYATADAGRTFTYEISEVDTGEDGIRYDETIVTATVRVTDNGDGTLATQVAYDGTGDPHRFENWVTVMLARTGGPGVGMLGVAVVLAGCAIGLRRRRRRLR